MSSGVRRFFSTLRGGRLLVALALGIALLVALGRLASGAYIEILWQGEAGYASVFWRRVLWQWGVRVAAGVAVAIVVFLNLRVVSATLGGIQIKRRFGNLEISEQLPRSYVLWGMAGVSALLALWFGAAVPRNLGLQVLLLRSAGSWGLPDPVLGHDASFYVFWVPVLGSAITYLLIVTFLVFTLATAGYAATGALRWGKGRVDAQDLTRLHLGLLLGLFLVLLAARLWLGRYLLLLDGSSAVRGIFGYADAEARLPALQTLTVICVAGGVGAAWGAWKNRAAPLLASFSAVVLGMLLIGEFYPALVQSFRVEPNQLERETPYIEHSLDFTRLGFGLERMEERTFRYDGEVPIDWEDASSQFTGLPVWTSGALLTTYRSLESRRPYYDFGAVAIDRYDDGDGPVPVAVSVREVDPVGVQEPNWQNVHLRELYVEGMGAVASLASDRTPEGRPPMLLSGIPPVISRETRAIPGLALERSDVYFGIRQQQYAVIDGRAGQFLAPDGSPGVPGTDYPLGIELGGLLRTALFAWRFQDANLLFASELTDESRFIYRRRVTDRIRAIAPWLRMPEAPYPVIADGRLVWIVEGFSGTRAFPLSAVYPLGDFRPQVTYARNSVKVVVDAVTGQVDFYRVPIDDPLIDAYATAFPGLFKPIEEMPLSIREHVRYSTEMLNLQSQVLLQYHQETAAAFHGQQDVWDLARELAQGTNQVQYLPEYGIYRLPGEAERTFNLTTVFVPAGRDNLTAILAGRVDPAGVPELILYEVPEGSLVPGPLQVEALVEQDPLLSQQFSLWRTGGSEVWMGHLHIVPSGDRLLYMEPVFLAAEADAIPELRRFVVSDGVRVEMTEDLAGAIAALAGRALPSPSTDGDEGSTVPTDASAPWAGSALELLERAEARARAGDWQGFGEALEELRALLRTLERGGR